MRDHGQTSDTKRKQNNSAIKSSYSGKRQSSNKFGPIRRTPIPRAASKSKGVETLHPLKAGHSNKAFELHRPWTSNGTPLLAFCTGEIKTSEMLN